MAVDIVTGSQELNRMLLGIKLFVPTILGCVPQEEVLAFLDERNSTELDVHLATLRGVKLSQWKFYALKDAHYKGGATICKVEFLLEDKVIYRHVSDIIFGKSVLPDMNDIALVYGGHQEFLDSMIKIFPSLKKSLEPLLEAAQMTKK